MGIGEVSDKYSTLFTPARIAFLIWDLIYVAFFAFSVYHLRAAYKQDEQHPANKATMRIGWLFILVNLAASAWLVAWTHEWLSLCVALILVQLISLLMIHARLGIYNARESMESKVFTQLPVSIYLGWMNIAVFANISSWLVAIKWSGWGVSSINWTITMIAIIVLITLSVISRKKNVFFGLAIIWGLYGITLKRIAIDQEEYQPVILIAQAGMAIIAFVCLLAFIRNLIKR